jgi:hypothetical protein
MADMFNYRQFSSDDWVSALIISLEVELGTDVYRRSRVSMSNGRPARSPLPSSRDCTSNPCAIVTQIPNAIGR